MIPKATQSMFWNIVHRGATQAAEELSINLVWKGPTSEGDRAAQKQLVQQFTNQGVDGILLAPLDSRALAAEATTAMAKGIPVIIFDSGIEGEVGKDYLSFVATDNSAAGRLGGKHLASLLGEGGKAVLLRHMEGHESTTKREEGALEELKSAGVEILVDNRYAGASAGDAQTTAMNMIDVLREAGGIFAPNQTSSEGLVLALRQTNLAGKVKVVGFDSSPLLVDALRNGEIDALVVQDPVKMGYLSVKLMADHLDGKTIESQVNTAVHLVTRDAMDRPEIKPLLE
ncbi:MAG: sugar ABC transporter substrate-binding protein [Planctomycetota bacterium]|nr:MAG: sugar ABC transporter substrate-binding protein [Planctomycetota bacterium]